MPIFSGDNDKYEINPLEWLKRIRKKYITSYGEKFQYSGEVEKWWMSIHNFNRKYITWE